MMKSVTRSSCAAWALSLCLVLSSIFAGAAWAGEPQVLRIPIDEEPDSFNVARVSDYPCAPPDRRPRARAHRGRGHPGSG